MTDRIEVKLRFAEGVVTMEGPEDFIDKQLRKLSSGQLIKLSESGSQASAPETIRDFVQAKKPKGHHELIATLAFWLKQQGQAEFTPEEIRKCYIRAEERLPKVIEQALRDAKNKFDYVDGERGSYKLTDHGYNVVRFDLPRKGDK